MEKAELNVCSKIIKDPVPISGEVENPDWLRITSAIQPSLSQQRSDMEGWLETGNWRNFCYFLALYLFLVGRFTFMALILQKPLLLSPSLASDSDPSDSGPFAAGDALLSLQPTNAANNRGLPFLSQVTVQSVDSIEEINENTFSNFEKLLLSERHSDLIHNTEIDLRKKKLHFYNAPAYSTVLETEQNK